MKTKPPALDLTRRAKEIVVRRLSPADVADYCRLRLRGLRECPAAFGSSYREEVKRPVKAFSARLKPTDDTWTFGATDGGALVGVITLIRDDKTKERHKASIFGLYVDRKARRKNIGRALLEHAIQTARQLPGLKQVRLSVVDSNLPSVRLYRSAGFTEYGREEAALFVAGKYYSEFLFVLRL